MFSRHFMLNGIPMGLVKIWFAFLLTWQTAFAQNEYSRSHAQFRASDYAKDQFGTAPQSSYNQSQGINFGSVSANLRTTLDCGKIDVIANFDAQFKDLQSQGEALLNSLKGAGSSIPLLITCYTMPQVCAFLRHDLLQLGQSLSLRSNACAMINAAIEDQSDKGARQLRAEAKKNCIDGHVSGGDDLSTATAKCDRNSPTGLPLRDFSQSVRNVQLGNGQTQRALFAMLKNVREESSYDFLASLLGEIEVQTDGSWQPLWPVSMLKPRQISTNYIRKSTNLICGNLRGIVQTPALINASNVPSIETTIQKYLTAEDADMLDDLMDQDRQLACAALGRAVGLISAKQISAHHDSIFSSALSNTAVPTNLRDEFRARAQGAFDALERALASEQIPNLESVRSNIRELARYMRASSRKGAASLSRARSQNQSEHENDSSDCFDSYSCQ